MIDSEVKIVLLGNSGVGKTSLCQKWTEDTFNAHSKTTVGSHLHPKKIRICQRDVNVSVWDTAGQEQYKSLVPLYTRSASCAIIVGDIMDKISFEDTYEWQSMILESNNERPPLILALNKVDLVQDNVQETMAKYVEQYGHDYDGVCICSAKTGEGIDNVFDIAARKAIEYSDKVRHAQDSSSHSLEDANANSRNKKRGCC